MTTVCREHLFISYATEDAPLAEWLTLRLTAEGYKVWCDRFKLLGGESYPRDIDDAIKNQTFRFLALLSRHSLAKPNPVKERTLAVNITRARKLSDFVVPLNVDGLQPAELDWHMSDLTFISFHASWAQGLAQLLKKLRSIDAPCTLTNGKNAVTDWFALQDAIAIRPERLWTNLIPVEEIPERVLRFNIATVPRSDWPESWMCFRQSDQIGWGFERPAWPGSQGITVADTVAWKAIHKYQGVPTIDLVTSLLKLHLRRHCLRKEVLESADGELYLPPGIVPGDWLKFESWDGRGSRVLATGQRTFRRLDQTKEVSRYHLAPVFRPALRKFGDPVIQIQLRLFMTDMEGQPLAARTNVSRRRRICKDWWNTEWVKRLLGLMYWLADGAAEVDISPSRDYRIVLGSRPLQLAAPAGIIENAAIPNDEAKADSLELVEDNDDESAAPEEGGDDD